MHNGLIPGHILATKRKKQKISVSVVTNKPQKGYADWHTPFLSLKYHIKQP